MKCACCGKKKPLFGSYAPINEEMQICIKCDTVLCRIRVAAKDGNREQYEGNVKKVRAFMKKAGNAAFEKWFEAHLQKITDAAGEKNR